MHHFQYIINENHTQPVKREVKEESKAVLADPVGSVPPTVAVHGSRTSTTLSEYLKGKKELTFIEYLLCAGHLKSIWASEKPARKWSLLYLTDTKTDEMVAKVSLRVTSEAGILIQDRVLPQHGFPPYYVIRRHLMSVVRINIDSSQEMGRRVLLCGLKALQGVSTAWHTGETWARRRVQEGSSHSVEGERGDRRGVWGEGLLQHGDPSIVRGGVHHQAIPVLVTEYPSVGHKGTLNDTSSQG